MNDIERIRRVLSIPQVDLRPDLVPETLDYHILADEIRYEKGVTVYYFQGKEVGRDV